MYVKRKGIMIKQGWLRAMLGLLMASGALRSLYTASGMFSMQFKDEGADKVWGRNIQPLKMPWRCVGAFQSNLLRTC